MSGEQDEKPMSRRIAAGCYSLPWCSIFLVGAAITAHTLVYMGNLATAKTFSAIGSSTSGWADVGTSVSGSLKLEIEDAMTKTSNVLTDALRMVVELENDMDLLLGKTGNSTNEAIQAFQKARSVQLNHDLVVLADTQGAKASSHGNHSQTLVPDLPTLRAMVTDQVYHTVESLKVGLHKFFELIKPALLQVGKWLVSMGDKIQGFIEQFSQTIDKAQKMFDQVMAQVADGPPVGGRDHILYETFNIFDISHSGGITAHDIAEVSNLYGVTALNGKKGAEMLEKYDKDNNGELDWDEYDKFVEDPNLPQVMAYVIRVFAKRLSSIAGVLKGARMRDEVAASLGDYLELMAAKNLTKVGWISQSLLNQSKPDELTIDVWKQLWEMENAPDKLVDLPTGLLVTTQMLMIDAPRVSRLLERMAEPDLWDSQGWDMADQAKAVHQVTVWVANASAQIAQEHAALFSNVFLQEESGIHPQSSKDEIFDQLARVSYRTVQKRVEAFQKKRLQAKMQRHGEIFYAAATSHVYRHLLGQTHMVSSRGSGDEDVHAALKSGIPAVPATLEFAQFLVNNATDTSQRFQKYAFDYAKTSSNQIDSFANGIQSMIKKVQNFLNLMMDYATPRGINDFEAKIEEFTDHAMDDLTKVVDNIISETLSKADSSNVFLLQHGTQIEQTQDLSGTFTTIQQLLGAMKSILPTVVDDLKFAKTEVSSVSETLKSIFSMLKVKGSPIFDQVSSLYKMVWTAYYSVFLCLSLLLLFYAFWANGFIAAPSGEDASIVKMEPGCIPRLKRCCSTCVQCLRDCQDTHLCLWSCVIISELVILVMFLVAIVFCILGGIKALVAAGCAQIYMLGDDTTCTSILSGLRNWMETFWTDQPSAIDEACDAQTLTACQVISANMMKSAMYTIVGSFVAAIFSLQLIFDTAHNHEKAYYINKLKPRTVYQQDD
jgi:hypothetical protein